MNFSSNMNRFLIETGKVCYFDLQINSNFMDRLKNYPKLQIHLEVFFIAVLMSKKSTIFSHKTQFYYASKTSAKNDS